jgi:hypothetical protein
VSVRASPLRGMPRFGPQASLAASSRTNRGKGQKMRQFLLVGSAVAPMLLAAVVAGWSWEGASR